MTAHKEQEFSPLYLQDLWRPAKESHKGENGKVLVIGGSSLFHSASLWGAELLAHFADLVFYYSPYRGNSEILLRSKERFQNGIVIAEEDLAEYVTEAEVVLIGPGMKRQVQKQKLDYANFNPKKITEINDEGELTYLLTNWLLSKFPNKKIVVDAGALQELELENIHPHQILTPHWQEFTRLFPEYSDNFLALSRQYPATYLIKKSGVDRVVSSLKPQEVTRITAGNEGLTKGGTGDLLAALVAAFYLKNPSDRAAMCASYILNIAADELYKQQGPYYTASELLIQIPKSYWQVLEGLKS